jgi:glutamine synthetase
MALSAEAEYALKTIEERGIRYVRLWFTDVLGFLKSFTITSQELEGAFAEGMGFDGSSIDGFSRIQESDMVAIPDPSTFQLIPWKTEAQVVRMFCDVLNPDGTPFEGDPRNVLKRQLARAAELGYTFYVGPELEYFYFRSPNDPSRTSSRWGSRSSTSITRWPRASTRSICATPTRSRWRTTS